MPRLVKFDVVFDNPCEVYYGGQTISGRVLIVLSAPLDANGIEIRFVGKASVYWTEKRFDEEDSYSASETYIDECIPLRGQEPLLAGEHVLPFTYTLPFGIPSSFEGYYGKIRYFCKATICRPWKFNHNCKMPFTVNSLLDLNQYPEARDSVINQEHKQICCFCCRSGPLSVVATIDHKGYVPGESIFINAEVDNLTDRKIDGTRAVLRAVITNYGSGSKKTEVKDIVEVKRGSIQPSDSDIWSAVPLHIPPIVPSMLEGCKIIDNDYRIDFIVDPAGPALDLVVSLPVLIGTIPLQNDFNKFKANTPIDNQTTAYGSMSSPLPQYPDAPPPSYAESVFGQVDIRDQEDNPYTHGKLNYTPVYAYYTNS